MGARNGGGGRQGVQAKERGIKIFSEQNEVMTKYPPGVCRAEGVSGKKDCFGKGKANVSKESLYRHTERRHVRVWAIQRKEEKVQKAVLNVLITFCFGARKHAPEKVQL